MRFRPCIDLRGGRVVQIVGGTLNDGVDTRQQTIVNFESDQSPEDYARLYQGDHLTGGHIISLGEGNESAAQAALLAYPNGMQYGGGVTDANAKAYLDAGATHVIVTSYVFRNGHIDWDRLRALLTLVGKHHLVLDLSCRWRDGEFWVVTDRWQRFTEVVVNGATLEMLAGYCDEFLVHGVDAEGKRLGIQAELVALLGKYSPCPVTYAGGARSIADLEEVKRIGCGRVDLTIGSALDIFGGDLPYSEVVRWQRDQAR